jgi:hypothetical protein
MNAPTTELLLRANGIQVAFGFEFGLESPRAEEGRATNPYRQANVSYSLVQRKETCLLQSGRWPEVWARLLEGREPLC